MRLKDVGQLQAMNEMMKQQFAYMETSQVMVLGIAGGNGLEHVMPNQYQKIYGVDINPHYLAICKQRYPNY